MPGKIIEEYSPLLLLVGVFILVARATSQVSNSITKGLDKVVLAEFVFSLIRPLCFALPLAIVYGSATQNSLNQVLLLFGVSFLIAAIASSLINSKSPLLAFQVKLASVPRLYQASFFFLLVSVGLPLMANINTILLGNLRSREEVALFATAAKLVSLVLLTLVSANLLIALKLSPMSFAKNIAGMRTLIRNNNAFVAVLTIIPIVIILLFAEWILGIFGPEYPSGAPLLRVLMIGQAASVFCGPVVLTSTLTGMQRSASLIVLFTCAINWLMCILMIPTYGAMGAVLASVIANVLMNGILAIVVYREIGLNVTMFNLVR